MLHRKKLITRKRFNDTICKVAENYGFKYVGKFHDFLLSAKDNSILTLEPGSNHTAVTVSTIKRQFTNSYSNL